MRETFVYCPRCATPLVSRATVDAALRPTCPRCKFVQFHDPKVAVTAFVVRTREPAKSVRQQNNREQVLLVQRGVDPQIGRWALPGGYMDAGELPEAALSRELREETGLAVRSERLLEILPLLRGDFADGIVLVYQAAPVDMDAPLASGDDVRDARWFATQDLPAEAEIAFESTRLLLWRWASRTNISGG